MNSVPYEDPYLADLKIVRNLHAPEALLGVNYSRRNVALGTVVH